MQGVAGTTVLEETHSPGPTPSPSRGHHARQYLRLNSPTGHLSRRRRSVSCSRPRQHWLSLGTEACYWGALTGSPHPSPAPVGGPMTHVSAVSFRDWFRPAASLGTCSDPKLHWLSLRAEGKGQSPGEACGAAVLLPPICPRAHGVPHTEGKGPE